jgi:hypothetical protein
MKEQGCPVDSRDGVEEGYGRKEEKNHPDIFTDRALMPASALDIPSDGGWA